MPNLLSLGFFLIPVLVDFWPVSGAVDQYTPIKWIMTLFIGAGLAIQLAGPAKVSLPRIGIFGYAALVLALSYLFSTLRAGSIDPIFEWFAFFSILIAAYSAGDSADSEAVMGPITRATLAATTIVIAYGLLEWAGVDLLPFLARNHYPASLFGFQNMTAEFMGVSILLQEINLKKFSKKVSHIQGSFQSRFQWGLLIVSLFYLLLLACRSVFIALLVAQIALYLFNKKDFKKITISVSLLMLFYSFGFSTINRSMHLPGARSSAMVEGRYLKMGNIELRFARWENTLALIQKNPWGVGPGNFEFSYIPFRKAVKLDYEASEQNVVTSPHNAFLELTANNGVLALLAFLFLLGLFCRVRTLSSAVLVFIFVDGFFAFPMSTPYLFFATAAFIGLALRSKYSELTVPPKWIRLTFFVAATFISLYAGRSAFSKYVQAYEPNDFTMNAYACYLNPTDWRMCVQQSALEFTYQMYPRSEATSRKMLDKNENNFLALQLLSEALMKQNRIPEACKYLDRYDALFNHQSGLHHQFQTTCETTAN